jgi:hypothetical protein
MQMNHFGGTVNVTMVRTSSGNKVAHNAQRLDALNVPTLGSTPGPAKFVLPERCRQPSNDLRVPHASMLNRSCAFSFMHSFIECMLQLKCGSIYEIMMCVNHIPHLLM